MLFYCKDDWALSEVAQRGIVSLLWDIQKPSGRSPGQLAVGDHAWAGELNQMTSRSSFQPQPVCDSVKTYTCYTLQMLHAFSRQEHVHKQS